MHGQGRTLAGTGELTVCLEIPVLQVCIDLTKHNNPLPKKKSAENKGALANILFPFDKPWYFWGESTANGIRSFIYAACKYNLKVQLHWEHASPRADVWKTEGKVFFKINLSSPVLFEFWNDLAANIRHID